MSPRNLPIAFTITFLSTIALSAGADDNPPACTENSASSGDVNAYRQYSPRSGKCIVSVHSNADDKISRSYLFTNEGQVMVFNSHGDGPNSTHTSARVFFFFPRRNLPSVESRGDGQVAVTLANSQIIRFSPENTSIVGYTGGTVTEDSAVTFSNRGGIEFPSITSGIVLDCGWRLGETPIGRRSGSCEARDPAGTRCTIRNTDLFRFVGGEPIFKYATDAELKTLLDRRCPRLEAGSLLPPPPSAPTADSRSIRAQPADF